MRLLPNICLLYILSKRLVASIGMKEAFKGKVPMKTFNKTLTAALSCAALSCSLVLVAPLAESTIGTSAYFTAQAAEVKISKSSVTSGEYLSTLTLSLKGVPASGKAKIKWKVSGKALYPGVSPVRRNDYRAVELRSTGIEGAKSTVTATYKKRKYRCSVTCRYRVPVSTIMTKIQYVEGRFGKQEMLPNPSAIL